MADFRRTLGILGTLALTLGCAPQAPTVAPLGEPSQEAATSGYAVQQVRDHRRADRRQDRRFERREERRADRRRDRRMERRHDRRIDRRHDRRIDRRHRPSWWGRRTWHGRGYRPSWWGTTRYVRNRYIYLGGYYYPYYLYGGYYYPDFSSPFLYASGYLTPYYGAQPLVTPTQTYFLPNQAQVISVAPGQDPYAEEEEELLY